VNLSLADIAELPLAAALVDSAGAVIARTPEWDGPGPGAVSYPVRSVRLVVRMHKAQVSACYERAFKSEAGAPARGRVEIGFTIDKDGRARKVQVAGNDTGSDALGACLAERVGEWKFPKPIDGEFQTSYPFIFSSGAR